MASRLLAPPFLTASGGLFPLQGNQQDRTTDAVARSLNGEMQFAKQTANGPPQAVRVELRGFEPLTPCMPCKCSARLSYSPLLGSGPKRDRHCISTGAGPDLEKGRCG